MNARFSLALACLAALGAGVVVTWLVTGSGPKNRTTLPVDGQAARSQAGSPTLLQSPASQGGPGGAQGRPGPLASAGGGTSSRVPHGIDLSDPTTRAEALAAALGAVEINWGDVRNLLGLMDEPLDAEAKRILLENLKIGPRRTQVVHALEMLADETMLEALFAFVDDASADISVRNGTLTVLARMRGGEPDEIAKALEQRLRGSFGDDVYLLKAIAERGGVEATRAVLRYLAESGDIDPAKAAVFVPYAPANSPEAHELVVQALRDTKDPARLVMLLDAMIRPGMTGVTAEIAEAAKSADNEALQVASLRALARLGDQDAIQHLLAAAREPGSTGSRALDAMGFLQRETVTEDVRKDIRTFLEQAHRTTQPDYTRRVAIETLGRLGDRGSRELLYSYVSDRNPAVANEAILALGRLGAASRERVNDLGTLWAGGDEARRLVLIQTMGRVGGPDAAALLTAWGREDGNSPQVLTHLRLSQSRVEQDLR